MYRSSILIAILTHYGIFIDGEATVKPVNPFDAAADAKKLYEILTISSDRTTDFVNLVTKRSCDQRARIKEAFDKKYGPLDYFTPEPPEYSDQGYLFLPSCFKCNASLYALHADWVFGQDWANELELTEILFYCTRTPELHELCLSEYKKIYNQDLGIAIDKKVGTSTGDFRNIAMEMIRRKRAAKSPSDQTFIQNTAQALKDEMGNWGNERKVLDSTLFEISLDVLQQVMIKFQEINGKSLVDEVHELESSKSYAYELICNFILEPVKSSVDMIQKSIIGKSTDELLLMRVVLMTSETNIVEVKQAYEQEYKESLFKRLQDDGYMWNNKYEYGTKLLGFLGYPLSK